MCEPLPGAGSGAAQGPCTLAVPLLGNTAPLPNGRLRGIKTARREHGHLAEIFAVIPSLHPPPDLTKFEPTLLYNNVKTRALDNFALKITLHTRKTNFLHYFLSIIITQPPCLIQIASLNSLFQSSLPIS